jgi:hypothetical protein
MWGLELQTEQPRISINAQHPGQNQINTLKLGYLPAKLDALRGVFLTSCKPGGDSDNCHEEQHDGVQLEAWRWAKQRQADGPTSSREAVRSPASLLSCSEMQVDEISEREQMEKVRRPSRPKDAE